MVKEWVLQSLILTYLSFISVIPSTSLNIIVSPSSKPCLLSSWIVTTPYSPLEMLTTIEFLTASPFVSKT